MPKRLTAADWQIIRFALLPAFQRFKLDRATRQQISRVRDKVEPYLQAAEREERPKKAARARLRERRLARQMPAVDRNEADEWHRFLSGERKEKRRDADRAE
jgi:hypothetical protein